VRDPHCHKVNPSLAVVHVGITRRPACMQPRSSATTATSSEFVYSSPRPSVHQHHGLKQTQLLAKGLLFNRPDQTLHGSVEVVLAHTTATVICARCPVHFSALP